ncbi:hypothetical protein GGQ75_004284 [Aureimonas phyllosphaerae]|nr:hypothetical protein [Aureimonas phyllosphaerae]
MALTLFGAAIWTSNPTDRFPLALPFVRGSFVFG